MSRDADPVIEVADAPTKRRIRRENVPPLTRLYLTSLPEYVPKQRYDRLQFSSTTEENGNSSKELEEKRMAKVRTCYCLTVSIFWTFLFYAISLSAIPAFVLVVISLYDYYIQEAKTLSMSNSTNTSTLSMNSLP
jgi:hypothetical protein